MESQESSQSVTSSSFDFANHEFKLPVKKIDDPASHENFKKSDACGELLSFIAALATACQNSRMQETVVTEVRTIDKIIYRILRCFTTTWRQ